jgi:hypothetical protein
MPRTTKQMNEIWLRDTETRGGEKDWERNGVKNGRIKWSEIKERHMRRQMSDSDLKWRKKDKWGDMTRRWVAGVEAGAWLQQLTGQEVINFLSLLFVFSYFLVAWKADGAMLRNELCSRN